jgi:ABC-type nitrate/sulfonate/bicarbonate transport system ATPase subunit
MRRRVAFLTSVAARPQVLLLDEPFSALDEPTRVAIHQSIYAIMRELKMTAVLVTHDLEEAVSGVRQSCRSG